MSKSQTTQPDPWRAPRQHRILTLLAESASRSARRKGGNAAARLAAIAILIAATSCSSKQPTAARSERTDTAEQSGQLAPHVAAPETAAQGSGTKGSESSTNAQAQQNIPPAVPSDQQGLSALPALQDKKFDAAIHDIVVREDPVIDGWDTEMLAERTLWQLNQLGQLLKAPDSLNAAVASPEFRSTELRPGNLQVAYEATGIIIRRPQGALKQVAGTGKSTFVAAIRPVLELFRGAEDIHHKFKIIRAARDDRRAQTRAFVEFSGMAGGERKQINATWDCDWELPQDLSTGQPLLKEIQVLAYEEVAYKSRFGKLFSDCTQAALRDLSALETQLVHGRDHWYGNLEATIGVEGRGNGIAIGDVNGDLLEDIYICQPAALPNRLFVRQADGSLKDVSAEANVDWLDSTRAALLVDLDNDGDQDLVTTHTTSIVIQENDGRGTFTARLELLTDSRLFSTNAIDLDNDRRLDLFVCGYSSAANTRPEDVFISPVPYHDANNGGPNYLFRNLGEWKFQDITAQVGLDANNLKFSLASAWDDFDNDGDLDLYVANDFGRNNLYRNDGGKFVDIAGELDVEDIGPGMSATWNDYDNDGDVDLYVSNMFSSAGSRITHNAKFKPGAAADDLADFQRHARGNSLFKNDGGKGFTDESAHAGVTMGRWAWGSLLTDINNDGWRDVYVTNGFVTADNNNDL